MWGYLFVMKYIITESQHRRLFEEEQKVLHFPSLEYFNGDWNILQKYMERKVNSLYSLGGDLNLLGSELKSLGNLTSVGGDLLLNDTPIESLGNLTFVGGNLFLEHTPIESLGNLTSVGGFLYLNDTPIESLGNLTFVGGSLFLKDTPISKNYSKEEIRQMVNVVGGIFL